MPTQIGNLFIKTVVNSPLHPLLGDRVAVITVQGRRTGKRISTPINLSRAGETWMVISMRNRTWWRNLREGRHAELRVAGHQVGVCGEIVSDPSAVEAGLANYFNQHPADARYFKILLGLDGKPSPEGIKFIAKDRLLIMLHPD
jgi:hypothetical protein